MATLYDVLIALGLADCAALRSPFPVAGVLPESRPATTGRPLHADLMAKDSDLAIAFAGRFGGRVETTELGRRALAQASAQGPRRQDFSALAVAVAVGWPAGTSDEASARCGLDDDDRRHPLGGRPAHSAAVRCKPFVSRCRAPARAPGAQQRGECAQIAAASAASPFE